MNADLGFVQKLPLQEGSGRWDRGGKVSREP